jgi:signal transduction histidine kinase
MATSDNAITFLGPLHRVSSQAAVRVSKMLALAALLAVAVSYQSAFTWSIVAEQREGGAMPRPPFQFSTWNADAKVIALTREAAQSGIQRGERVLSISGRIYRGEADFWRELSRHRSGDKIALQVSGASGQVSDRFITLAPSAGKLKPGVEIGIIYLLLPWLCLFLAVLVVLLRPDDHLAWLLLALMLSFSQIAAGGPVDTRRLLAFPEFIRDFGIVHGIFWWSTWPLWMFLFAIYFPRESSFFARRSWLKWLYVVPAMALAAVSVAAYLAMAEDASSGAVLLSTVKLLGPFRAILNVGTLLFLSASLGRKLRTADATSKRRLRLLLAGVFLGFAPYLSLELTFAATGKHASAPLRSAAELAILFFPVALCYAVSAQRIMEAQLIIRHGLQYAVARQGIVVLQFIAGLCVVIELAALSAGVIHGFSWHIIAVAAALLTIAVLRFFLSRLALWLDRCFFRDAHNAERMLAELAHTVHSIDSIDTLLATVVSRAAGALHVSRIAVFLEAETSRTSPGDDASLLKQSHAIGAPLADVPALNKESRMVQRLSRGGVPLLVEGNWMDDIPAEEQPFWAAMRVELLVPLIHNGRLSGIVALGPKRSEIPYSRKEIDLLRAVANQAALAIENNRLAASVAAEMAKNHKANVEKEAAKRASEAKSSFLAHVSHELRTPLNAIIGYSEMLLEEAEEGRLEECVGDIHKICSSGKYLLELINNILAVSKLEAGKMQLHLERFPVSLVLQHIESLAQPLAAKNRNRCVVESGETLGEIHTDRTKLTQCLLNLMSNAFKFTVDGSVTLRARRYRRKAEDWIRFEVSDSGIGLAPEQIKKLFQPFEQADASVASRFGGTGLGLSLSRGLCRIMGGDIAVKSELGRGSTFTIELPCGTDSCDVPQLT